jgi:hypothetical protein
MAPQGAGGTRFVDSFPVPDYSQMTFEVAEILALQMRLSPLAYIALSRLEFGTFPRSGPARWEDDRYRS